MNSLSTLFPELAARITEVLARLFDLERVFKEGYAHPGFLGRTSIKNVLPVLVPELSYAVLAIQGGEDASAIFGLMRVGEYAAHTHQVHRERLLAYCQMDTRGMVRLHEAVLLIRAARDPA